MNDAAAIRDHWTARFGARSGSSREPGWLASMRREAAARFAESGFPTTRWEEWRYTNAVEIAETRFEPAAPQHGPVELEELEHLCAPVYACSLYVFVNGRYEPDLSSHAAPDTGVEVRSLAELLAEEPAVLRERLGSLLDLKERPFAALNTAFFDDGAFVRIPRDTQLAVPVHLVFVSTATGEATAQHPRVWVEAEPGSRGVLIQDFVSVGEGRCLSNAVAEIQVGANAGLDWVCLQRESDTTHHVAETRVHLERDGRFTGHTLCLGGDLVRNDLGAVLAGEGGAVGLRGLYVGRGDQTVDNHTWVDHAVPHCTSDELYKGILDDASRGVFRGRVVVRPDAQKTDAGQRNPNLVLSDRAEVDSKPQLEIYADDVKCSHGSTIGQIDPDALFYLRSRGIGREDARDLLTRGFAAEITDGLPAPALGEVVSDLLLERLGRRGGVA